MSARDAAFWTDFWSKQNTPLHAEATEAHYREYASELKLLLGSDWGSRVLELGCGNGALYPHLGFDRAECYRGIDISESMLDAFHRRHPGVKVRQGSAHDYRDDQQYDLVFSNGLVQYFEPEMLAAHFENGRRMLTPRGRLICASVPWRMCRSMFWHGSLRENARWNSLAGILLYLKRRLIAPGLGHWYYRQEFEQIAAAAGFHAEFLGSLHYPYRFHAILRPLAAAGSSSENRAAA